MSEPTIKQCIERVRKVEPNATSISITIEVWDDPNKANSQMGIWNGKDHFKGKSLRQALDVYLAAKRPNKNDNPEPLHEEASQIISESQQNQIP